MRIIWMISRQGTTIRSQVDIPKSVGSIYCANDVFDTVNNNTDIFLSSKIYLHPLSHSFPIKRNDLLARAVRTDAASYVVGKSTGRGLSFYVK